MYEVQVCTVPYCTYPSMHVPRLASLNAIEWSQGAFFSFFPAMQLCMPSAWLPTSNGSGIAGQRTQGNAVPSLVITTKSSNTCTHSRAQKSTKSLLLIAQAQMSEPQNSRNFRQQFPCRGIVSHELVDLCAMVLWSSCTSNLQLCQLHGSSATTCPAKKWRNPRGKTNLDPQPSVSLVYLNYIAMMYLSEYTYIYIYVYIHVYMYICIIYIYMYNIYIYICIYVCVHT